MPTVSKKQEKFMQAVANSPKFAKKVGVPQSVGLEFTKGTDMYKKGADGIAKKGKTKGKAFAMGGSVEGDMMKKEGRGMAKAGMQKMKSGGMAALKEHAAKPASKAHAGLKSGGKVKKMMDGGMTRMPSRGEHSIQKKSTRGAEDVTMMKKGGGVKKMRMGGKC
jgi:hypothetical protein